MNKEKIGFKEKLGYALTAMGSDMTTQFTGSFLQLFYTSVVGIPIALASLVISLSVIWDAINDPLIASWVDNHRFKNGERMRPILLYSCVPFALFFVLIFTTIDASVSLKTLYSFGMYFIYMVPRTFYYLPVFTLRQVATPDLEERLSINAFISYGQAFGSSIPTLIMWPIMYWAAGTVYVDGARQMANPEKGYFTAALITAVVVVAFSVYNYTTTRERVKCENSGTKILDAMRLLIKDSNFIYNLVLFFFYGLVVTLTTGYAAYYTNYVLNRSAMLTPISAFYIVGTLAATPFVKKIYNSCGRNRAMVIGSVALAIGALVFTVTNLFRFTAAGSAIETVSLLSAFFFTFCVGVGTAITIIVIGINRADVTDVIEWRQGSRMDGMVSNVTSFIKKLAHALITVLLGVLLQLFGFVESTPEVKYPAQPESAKIAIVLVMGAGVLVSALMMAAFASKISLDEEIKRYKNAEDKSV